MAAWLSEGGTGTQTDPASVPAPACTRPDSVACRAASKMDVRCGADLTMQTFTINLQPNLGLWPPVLGLLAGIPESTLSHDYYNLRHPGGTFNKAFGAMVNDLLEVTTKVRAFSGDESDLPHIIEAYKRVLATLAYYLEAPYEILVSLCPPVLARPDSKEFLHKWLLSNKFKAGKTFYASTRGYVEYFRELHNSVKHKSSAIRSAMSVGPDGRTVLGYYLEGAEAGVIGPDLSFHTRCDKKRPPNSFNRDLRRLYYVTYFATEALARCIIQHLQQIGAPVPRTDSVRIEDDSRCRTLLESIRTLDDAYLSTEGNLLVPEPQLKADVDASSLVFDLSSIRTWPPGSYRATITTVSDGFSRSYKVPEF